MIKNKNKRSNILRVFGSLPILAFLVYCFSFETVIVAQSQSSGIITEADNPTSDCEKITSLMLGTIMEEIHGPNAQIDTFYTVDPETKKTSISFVPRNPKPGEPFRNYDEAIMENLKKEGYISIDPSQIDTLSIFDPKTKKETVKYLVNPND